MGITKQIAKWQVGLVFLYLVFLPLGVLPKLILGVHITDVIVLALFIISLRTRRYFKEIIVFILILVFSWIYSIGTIGVSNLSTGFLYLIRAVSYLWLIYIIYSLIKNKKLKKKLLLDSLVAVGCAIAVFGWIQLTFLPDLTSLKYFGWDDHYYRLTSTFLDPAFTGVILAITSWISYKQKKYLISIFLLITLWFTYSRSSYLAIIAVVLYELAKKAKFSKVLFTLPALVLILFLLIPRPQGEGGDLLRTKSIELKIKNSQTALRLIKYSPLFGVGFNNVCQAKTQLGIEEGGLHACSGLDNSFLFLLATTGIAGFISFLSMILILIKTTAKNHYGEILLGSLIIIFIHGQFTNTFFYPAIMGIAAILIGVRDYK